MFEELRTVTKSYELDHPDTIIWHILSRENLILLRANSKDTDKAAPAKSNQCLCYSLSTKLISFGCCMLNFTIIASLSSWVG